LLFKALKTWGKKDKCSGLRNRIEEINNIDITDGLRIIFTNKDIIHLRPSGNTP